MRKPFVGMSLQYCPGNEESITAVEGSPLAATVALVREDGLVNLSVLDSEGRWLSRSGVRFVGPGDSGPGDLPPRRGFCTPSPAVAEVDDTTCLADLAARLDNVEAKLAEVAAGQSEQHPTLGVESPSDPPPDAEDNPEHPKRGRRR